MIVYYLQVEVCGYFFVNEPSDTLNWLFKLRRCFLCKNYAHMPWLSKKLREGQCRGKPGGTKLDKQIADTVII